MMACMTDRNYLYDPAENDCEKSNEEFFDEELDSFKPNWRAVLNNLPAEGLYSLVQEIKDEEYEDYFYLMPKKNLLFAVIINETMIPDVMLDTFFDAIKSGDPIPDCYCYAHIILQLANQFCDASYEPDYAQEQLSETVQEASNIIEKLRREEKQEQAA